MQAYGSTKAFGDWFLKVLRHYGEGGKEGFLSSLQMAGDDMKRIWKKFKNGKSRAEILQEFSETVVELAEESMKDPKRWEKISKAWNKVGHSAITFYYANMRILTSLCAV
jgi:hypothetical protein